MKRREAKALGLPTYFADNLCKNGHVSERYTKNYNCIQCAKDSREAASTKQSKRICIPTESPRSEALKLGLVTYFDGKACKNGHVSERYTRNYGCVQCESERALRYRVDNVSTINANRRERKRSRDESALQKDRAYARAYYKRNPTKYAEYSERYKETTRETQKQRSRQPGFHSREYQKRRAYYIEKAVSRNKRIKQNTPPWLTKAHRDAIRKIYKECPKGYHVDHIIPLNGENVCGLHVPWNLQYLPAEENLRKKNHFIDGSEFLPSLCPTEIFENGKSEGINVGAIRLREGVSLDLDDHAND